jgi:hypothetical protein
VPGRDRRWRARPLRLMSHRESPGLDRPAAISLASPSGMVHPLDLSDLTHTYALLMIMVCPALREDAGGRNHHDLQGSRCLLPVASDWHDRSCGHPARRHRNGVLPLSCREGRRTARNLDWSGRSRTRITPRRPGRPRGLRAPLRPASRSPRPHWPDPPGPGTQPLPRRR